MFFPCLSVALVVRTKTRLVEWRFRKHRRTVNRYCCTVRVAKREIFAFGPEDRYARTHESRSTSRNNNNNNNGKSYCMLVHDDDDKVRSLTEHVFPSSSSSSSFVHFFLCVCPESPAPRLIAIGTSAPGRRRVSRPADAFLAARAYSEKTTLAEHNVTENRVRTLVRARSIVFAYTDGRRRFLSASRPPPTRSRAPTARGAERKKRTENNANMRVRVGAVVAICRRPVAVSDCL